MIQKLLLNTQKIYMIFIKTLKNTIPIRSGKNWLYLLNPIVTELFIRGRKLSISLVFFTQSYLTVPKRIKLNSTHYFVMKVSNKRELQQIAFNHSWDIDFQDFMNLYKKCIAKPYLFWWLILLLQQVILQISERIFYKEHKN